MDVVDQSINTKRKAIEDGELSSDTERDMKNASFEEEVKVRHSFADSL